MFYSNKRCVICSVCCYCSGSQDVSAGWHVCTAWDDSVC